VAIFVTVAFDENETGEKFLGAVEKELQFVTTERGSTLVHDDDVTPSRIIKTEYVTKED
jgi:hypothetical protein